MSPSCFKMAPRWLNIAQHSAKMSQHSLQEPPTSPPQDPKMWPERHSDAHFYMSAIFAKFGPFKIDKMAPQLASRWRSGAQLGPSWRHLGSILAPSWPTWPHLGPSWRQDAPQYPSKWSPRCAPNRILGQLGAKRVTEDLKSVPGASIFNDFSLNLGPNSIDFSSSFL